MAAALVVAALSMGCEGQPTGFSGQVSVDQFLSAVHGVVPGATAAPAAARGTAKAALAAPAAATEPVVVQGELRAGSPPPGPEPGAFLQLESSIITGIPAKLRVAGGAPFSRVAIGVTGAEGYWEIVLPAPVTELQVVATAATTLPNTSFELAAAVGSAAGFGPMERRAIQAVDLGSSDVAVILRWNALSDVDLHVTDAKGTRVFYGNPSTSEGGQLDLDSNPACEIDGVNQEVVSWPLGRAPAGEYLVEVDYWSDCGVARSDYTVTFMVRGRTIHTANGSFDGQPVNRRHEVARVTFP